MKFSEIEQTVRRKLRAKVREGGDRMLVIYCDCGHWLGFTKVSRRPSEQVSKSLAASVPKELGISKELWADIVGCQKGWLEYQAAHGHAH